MGMWVNVRRMREKVKENEKIWIAESMDRGEGYNLQGRGKGRGE